MRYQFAFAAFTLLITVGVFTSAANAAKTYNSSRSNKTEGISGGDVTIESMTGSALFLRGTDHAWAGGITTDHVLIPHDGDVLLGESRLPSTISPQLIDELGTDLLSGVMPEGFISWETGSITESSLFSISSGSLDPQALAISKVLSSKGLAEQLSGGADEQGIVTTTTLNSAITRQGLAIAASYERSFFTAHSNAQLNLAMRFEELEFLFEGEGLAGLHVSYAFGTGSLIDEETTSSDNYQYAVYRGSEALTSTFSLRDIEVFNLSFDLEEGQQYWFRLDTFSYAIAVPEPSTGMLAGLGSLALLLRRRRQ